jgi:hypothetical protein
MIKKYPQWFFLILGYEQSKNLPALWKFSRRQKRAFLYKKQQMWCRNCDRQWLIDPIRQPINREKKEQVISLLKERLSLSGICRVCKISMGWLLWFLQTPGKCLDYQAYLTSTVGKSCSP